LIKLFRGIFFKALGNVNVNYLKIPKRRRGPHKRPSRATCRPRVWDPCYNTSVWEWAFSRMQYCWCVVSVFVHFPYCLCA